MSGSNAGLRPWVFSKHVYRCYCLFWKAILNDEWKGSCCRPGGVITVQWACRHTSLGSVFLKAFMVFTQLLLLTVVKVVVNNESSLSCHVSWVSIPWSRKLTFYKIWDCGVRCWPVLWADGHRCLKLEAPGYINILYQSCMIDGESALKTPSTPFCQIRKCCVQQFTLNIHTFTHCTFAIVKWIFL